MISLSTPRGVMGSGESTRTECAATIVMTPLLLTECPILAFALGTGCMFTLIVAMRRHHADFFLTRPYLTFIYRITVSFIMLPSTHPSHTATVSYNTRGRLAPHNISTYPLPFSVTASPVSRVFILVKNIQGSLGPPCISWIRSRRTLSFRGFLSFLVVSTTQQYLRTYLPSLCIPTYASHADFWPSLLNGRPHLY
ncbi:hypothetical protein EDC04DRAFT_348526 [Pisolithus marmoratus]|nr:hypothetical protein EDC04DRAFT_348526 [Pisolithus marmoratus]